MDQVRDGRLAEEADPDRGQRDAELAGRQVLGELVHLTQRELGLGVVVGDLLEPRSARSDERELGGTKNALTKISTAIPASSTAVIERS